MANKKTTIVVTHGSEAYQTIVDRLLKSPTKPKEEMVALRNFFHAAAGCDRSAQAVVNVTSGDEVNASATVTIVGPAIGDTAVVSGTTFTAVDHKERTNITLGADSSGSLNNKWFQFTGPLGKKYYVWYNINSAGTDPAPTGFSTANGIVVSGATGATAATLATATTAAIVAFAPAGITATNGASTHTIITHNTTGVFAATVDGTATSTGFTFTRDVTGSTVSSVQYDIGFNATDAAANLVAAINAHSALKFVATATSAAGVVTVSSYYPGPVGNYITLTATTGNTASAATLGSGAVATTSSAVNTYHMGV